MNAFRLIKIYVFHKLRNIFIENFVAKIEVFKKIVEITAIIIAGIWTYQKFINIDVDLIKPRIESKSSLIWSNSTEENACYADMEISIKNVGVTAFKVNKLSIDVWTFYQNPPECEVCYYDMASNISGDPTEQHNETDGVLATKYGPSEASHNTYTFRFKRDKNKTAYFRYTVYVEPTKYSSEEIQFVGYNYNFINP